MAVRWLTSSGNFSSTSVWNDGATLGIPTTGDDVFTNGFTVNMDVNATVSSLNNSVLTAHLTRLNPVMTSNTTPSGIASASSSAGGGTAPWIAFNGVINVGDNWLANAGTPQWIQYQFASSLIVRSYSIFYISSQTGRATSFNLQGSNDGISFTTLDTRTGFAFTNGAYNTLTITNPTTAYSYYRLNITATDTGNPAVVELTFNEAGITTTAGGSFNFNTAGVSVTCTSTSASLSAGATNLITVTATTGTVTLNLGSATTTSVQCFNHTGACNFTLNGVRYSTGGVNVSCISKSSSGTITITGDLSGGNGAASHALSSIAGNTIVTGSVSGGVVGFGINQTAGNVTVTGNVTGGTGGSVHGISLTGAASQFTINGNVTGGSATSAHGINFGGTLGTVNGNVTGGGGGGARGVNAGTASINVAGNVTGNLGEGILVAANTTVTGNVFASGNSAGISNGLSNNSFTVTVTGDVYASNTQAGIQLTGTGTQVVNLTGNMYNTLGRMAIWCPNVFISNTATTLWRVDTGGGDYKFLYSADTTPNLPPITDVRFGTTYGPALSLTGTMVVLANSDVRKDVPNDNSVGTAELTSADIISGINASSDPLAVRLKNALTDVTAGNLISQYKDS